MAVKIEAVLDSDSLLIDEETGFAVNIPAELQKPYQWWLIVPEAYERVKQIRKALDLNIVDDLDGSMAQEKKSAIIDLFGEEK